MDNRQAIGLYRKSGTMFNSAKSAPARSGQKEVYQEDPFRMEHSSLKKKVTYEQPLNERVRNWLRLEYLFACVGNRIKSLSPWDSRAAVSGLIEILEFIGRTEVKNDLLKDLERHRQDLTRWRETPGVDQQRLTQLLEKLESLLARLGETEGQLGQRLAQNHLITMVRQRSTIPGGTCRFDLPAYYYWLQRTPKQRQNDLSEWLAIFDPLREAIELHLYLIRHNASTSLETASAGFFQTRLDPQVPYQLVRISLPAEYSCYPEISGGKHRFSVRFFEYESAQAQPRATEQDISFELCCCTA
jgi:cell division protein ZapD